jgi:predicted SAM-dependent methyltransferase
MKLHIGGKESKFGWKLLNIQPGPGVDYVGDISDLSQFGENSIKQVYASHVLEHVRQTRVLETLKGIHRVLVDGGTFYVSVPDLDVLCRVMIDEGATLDTKIFAMRMMFGGQVDDNDFHFVGWNEQILTHFLGVAGFTGAARVERFGIFKDTSEYAPYGFPISLNMIATK